jgi:hypothetical protein
VILKDTILKTYVTYIIWKGTNVKLPDDYIAMSEHVAVCTIQRDTVVILIVQLLLVIKTKQKK